MQRQAMTVEGIVQGVGFRPFVHRLASRHGLSGSVKNGTGSVLIEVEGTRESLLRFCDELQNDPPALSRIDRVQWQDISLRNETGFHIEPSDHGAGSQVFISPDVATCADCRAELFDPADRRYRYPFLNCTNCGPRLTIVKGAPYDRERTTMSGFVMCRQCRAEYDDPDDRRFHAQPTACPDCGPQLRILNTQGERIATDDPLAVFVEYVLRGEIGALKGLGGFHLVCDGRSNAAVSELRRRKHRDEKPLAMMVPDVAAARVLCRISRQEQTLLESHRRPIVLLRRRRESQSPREGLIAAGTAPGNPHLGLMLPYTPLHHLLMDAVGGIPLVMTSGNRSDEPIAYANDDAIDRLGDIADVFLTHDRPIHVRCDDSVTRVVDGEELPLRRSRGYAPEPITLPRDCPCPMLAVGGQLKGVFALGRGRQAFLSHHLGDLDHFAAYRAFEKDIGLYEQLFDIQPQVIVHDLHPDYASTRYAQSRAEEDGVRSFGVHHHHAHMASVMAEHGLDEQVIGITFDGTGAGLDDAIWGGEFLVGDYSSFERAAHLRYVRLPGGDRAVREPWRVAVAQLLDADCDPTMLNGVTAQEVRTIGQMIQAGFNSPLTSSAGRLFDAVAAIAGVRTHVGYEAQAAIELEWLATDLDECGHYPFALTNQETTPFTWTGRTESRSARDALRQGQLTPLSIDTRPLIRAIVQDVEIGTAPAIIARRFHSTLVEMMAAVCGRIRAQTSLPTVVLSGGVFLNSLLTREVVARLASDGFRVYRHRLVPPGDGGLCLGQLAIAAKTCVDVTISARQCDQSLTPSTRPSEPLKNSIPCDTAASAMRETTASSDVGTAETAVTRGFQHAIR